MAESYIAGMFWNLAGHPKGKLHAPPVPKEKKSESHQAAAKHSASHLEKKAKTKKKSSESSSDSDSSKEGESSSSEEDNIKSEEENSEESDDETKGKRSKKNTERILRQVKQINPPSQQIIHEQENVQNGGDLDPNFKQYIPTQQGGSLINKETVDLPSFSQLEEIFKKCSEFSLQNVQAKDIKSPYDIAGLTGGHADASGDDEDSPIDQINRTLEKNIKLLFSEDEATEHAKSFHIKMIRDALLHYVKFKTDVDHSGYKLIAGKENQVKKLKEQMFASVKDELPHFYDHLLKAMKALIVYVAKNTSLGQRQERNYEKHCYQAWKEVISYLKTLQIVITSAIDTGFLERNKYPLTIDDIMTQRDAKLKEINAQMDLRRRGILQSTQLLQVRDEKMREINEQFSTQEKQKADLEASILALQSQLSLIDDPVRIAQHNIKSLQDADST